MPLEAPLAPVAERVSDLNARYKHHSATAVLEHALSDPMVGSIALVSSFGAESVALLHMLSVMDRTTPVLFLDTEMLFEETLIYQREVAHKLGLQNIRLIRPNRDQIFARDTDGNLHRSDPDACCALRKTEPLQNTLDGFDSWITGRKRFQGQNRATLDFFENEDGKRIKVNPLVHWTPQDVSDYITNNRLPRHPLVAGGYPSIGCAPCTSQVAPGEDARAGRWRGAEKEECGIHFVNGKMVRATTAEISDANVDANVIVSDDGFGADDWTGGFAPLSEPHTDDIGLDLPSDTMPENLAGQLDDVTVIRVDFPSFADGRGFTIARQLRLMGYSGRLRARGHVIADQYAMARRAGFDEVEISADLAARQPEEQWRARANWQAHDYQSRLRGTV